jgi:hypothetical protein
MLNSASAAPSSLGVFIFSIQEIPHPRRIMKIVLNKLRNPRQPRSGLGELRKKERIDVLRVWRTAQWRLDDLTCLLVLKTPVFTVGMRVPVWRYAAISVLSEQHEARPDVGLDRRPDFLSMPQNDCPLHNRHYGHPVSFSVAPAIENRMLRQPSSKPLYQGFLVYTMRERELKNNVMARVCHCPDFFHSRNFRRASTIEPDWCSHANGLAQRRWSVARRHKAKKWKLDAIGASTAAAKLLGHELVKSFDIPQKPAKSSDCQAARRVRLFAPSAPRKLATLSPRRLSDSLTRRADFIVRRCFWPVRCL